MINYPLHTEDVGSHVLASEDVVIILPITTISIDFVVTHFDKINISLCVCCLLINSTMAACLPKGT